MKYLLLPLAVLLLGGCSFANPTVTKHLSVDVQECVFITGVTDNAKIFVHERLLE